MARAAQVLKPPRHVAPLVPYVLGTPWSQSAHPTVPFVDLFAGLGGATTGGVHALERLGFGKVGERIRAVAVNHDPDVLANAHEDHFGAAAPPHRGHAHRPRLRARPPH